MKNTRTSRCSWPGTDELMLAYHDNEWGKPCHDDKKLFEYIVLDTFQAGLNWKIILHKRENFRSAFANFGVEKIAKFTDKDLQRLLNDAGIIRNRLKIIATINNAERFLKVQREFGSFDRYIWQFVGGKPILNQPRQDSDIGATSPESENMSQDMKKRGFSFVGPTVCYAFMQGAGLVNDHLANCFYLRQ